MRGVVLLYVVLIGLALMMPATARDDGRYAASPLKTWFDSLRSTKGFCCSEADGRETEYDIRGDKYWVPINGTWIEVPDEAVLTEPNRLGRPMVWLIPGTVGPASIRCFLPGSGS